MLAYGLRGTVGTGVQSFYILSAGVTMLVYLILIHSKDAVVRSKPIK